MLAVGTTGCAEAREIRYPIFEMVPGEELPTADATASAELSAFAATPAEPARRIELGVADGPDHLTFAAVVDVAVDPVGRVFVLDAQVSRLSVFDGRGEYLGAWGREGEGPTDLSDPIDVDVFGADGVIVTTERDAKRIAISDSLVMIRAAPLPEGLRPTDACALDDTLYVTGWREGDGMLVHAVDSAGTGVGSFGTGYQNGSALVQRRLSAAFIACAKPARLVITAFQSFPSFVRMPPMGCFAGPGGSRTSRPRRPSRRWC